LHKNLKLLSEFSAYLYINEYYIQKTEQYQAVFVNSYCFVDIFRELT